MRTGEARIKGPATKEEKAEFDMWREHKTMFEEELEELQQLLRDEPDYEYRDQVIADIKHTQRVLQAIRKLVPD